MTVIDSTANSIAPTATNMMKKQMGINQNQKRINYGENKE